MIMTLIAYVPSYHGTKLERKNHFRRKVSIEKKRFDSLLRRIEIKMELREGPTVWNTVWKTRD